MHPFVTEDKIEERKCWVCGKLRVCGLVYIGVNDLDVYLCSSDLKNYMSDLKRVYDKVVTWQI